MYRYLLLVKPLRRKYSPRGRKSVVRFASKPPLLIIMCHDEMESKKAAIRAISFFLKISKTRRYVAIIAKVPIIALGNLTTSFDKPPSATNGINMYEQSGAL